MKTTASLVLGVPLAAGVTLSAATPPEMELTNSDLRIRVFLPDAQNGFYRGTRFDWSGVIGRLQFRGHEFYPPWFQRTDPNVHDFTYDGPDIVAGPCTAITGPAEEFVADGKALGFDAAKPGQTFVKIGVGALLRPDDKPYDPYRLYRIADGGRWTVTRGSDVIEFRQELSDAQSGYGYDYRKTVSLTAGQAKMVLGHSLRNTGQRVIDTSVYNHNFLFLDRRPPGPALSLRAPFAMQAEPPPDPSVAVVRGNELTFTRTLQGEDRVYATISGFGATAADYDFRVESSDGGVGVRITGDRPLARVALWTIRAPFSIEPFIALRIEPGTEFTWRLEYDYYAVAKSAE